MKKGLAVFTAVCLIMSALCLPAWAADTTLFIKPSDFSANLGTWTVVPAEQGSFFEVLKAPGDNKPDTAKPASVTFQLPADGSYHVFAYTRDYVGGVGETGVPLTSSNRNFKISVNGTTLEYVFGTHATNGWAWENGGSVELKAGAVTLDVIDTVNYYGRCQAIVLTTDAKFRGPVDAKGLENGFEIGAITPEEPAVTPAPSAKPTSTPAPTAVPTAKPTSAVPSHVPTQGTRPEDAIAVELNGSFLVFGEDSKPFTANDRTLVPFRAIFEALSCEVTWDDVQETAIGTRGIKNIHIPVGNNLAKVDGKPMYLDQPAVLQNDRVYVPLRFVAESLGAQVDWEEESQTVKISAEIPNENEPKNYLFTALSFSNSGTWFIEPAIGNSFPDGSLKGGTDNKPENTKPAVVEFNADAGEYELWVRSRDFPADRPGLRFFNVAVNGVDSGKQYGTHGKEGYLWVSGGKVTLHDGLNKLELIDSADFYARCDAVLITNTPNFVPSENYEEVAAIATSLATPPEDEEVTFPSFAREQAEPVSTVSLENEAMKINFYTVPTSNGTVVQNEILRKSGTDWVVTKKRSEDFGYLLVSADIAYSIPPVNDAVLLSTVYTSQSGALKTYFGTNIYMAGNISWLIPNQVSVSGDTAELTFFSEAADVKATWKLESGSASPVVEIQATYKKDGAYSIGAFTGSEVPASKADQGAQVSVDPGLLMFGNEAKVANGEVKSGIRLNGTKAGVTLRGPDGNFQGNVFYPVLGSAASMKKAGETQTMQVTVISELQ